MAMRHPKTIVLSGALAALIVMTVSSVLYVTAPPFYFYFYFLSKSSLLLGF